MKIGGLDIGTTGCKLTVFDQQGKYLDKAYRAYPVKREKEGHEIQGEEIWNCVILVLKEMAEKYPDISGIGITSFGETFVLTDQEGRPLLPSMLYTDPRGSRECSMLAERLSGDGTMEDGGRRIAKITGLRPHEMYSIPKVMWVKEHRPEIFSQVRHIFQIQDFIGFLLTGNAIIDYSLATRALAFDIRKLAWSQEILQAAGIPEELLSRPVPTGTAVGRVTAGAAALTGLSQDTVIVAVSHDQVAAAVGSGVFAPGQAVDGAGTVECITPVFDKLPGEEQMYEGRYCTIPYVVGGTYVSYAFSYTGGALIQWCVDMLAKKEKELAKEQGVSVNQLLETEYLRHSGKEGPTGLLVLPHFAGAATPYMDTGSRGAILGLTTATSLEEIYLACMEGVAYEMFLNTQRLKAAGVCFDQLCTAGGGARSALWTQMKADILNLPITALKTSDTGTVGSAMLTGIALGCFADLKDAAGHMIEKSVTYYPRSQVHEKYMEVYERYRRLYQAVRPLM